MPSYESGMSSLRLRHAAAPVLRDLVQDVLPAAGVSAPLATLFKLGPEDIERSARHYYFPIVEVGEWAGQHSMWGTPVEAGADPHAELISASSLGRCFPRSLRLVPMDDSLPPCRSGAGCRSPSTSRGAANPFRAYLEHRWDADFHWGPLISERSMDPRRFGLRP